MTVRAVAASAPGKLILMGEHAVVYGCPAVVAAVGLRVRTRIEARPGKDVELILPVLGRREITSWPAIRAYARDARRAWESYARQPGPESFAMVRGTDPAHLVRIALGEAANEVGPGALPAVSVEIESDLPVGAGFGSSAATAVSVVAALLASLDETASEERVDRLALEVERRQHGMPSGVDHKTVAAGGVLRFDRSAAGEWRRERLTVPASLLGGLAIFDTGRPAESTGQVVAAVGGRRDADRGSFDELLSRMRAAVLEFDASLRGASEGREAMARAMRGYESCLETLGVVPAPVREAIRRVEARGAAAKISGAGSLSDAGAGCLLVQHESGRPEAWPELGAFRFYPVEIGAEGLELH